MMLITRTLIIITFLVILSQLQPFTHFKNTQAGGEAVE